MVGSYIRGADIAHALAGEEAGESEDKPAEEVFSEKEFITDDLEET